jgi:hypothetical protein
LNAVARPFDDELEIAERAAMRSVGVGGNARFANGLSDLETGFVDERVMNRTMRDVDDAMAIRLKEADFGVSGVSAHRQARTMAMAATGRSMDPRIWKAGGSRDLENLRPCVLG